MRYLVEKNGPVDLSCLGTQGPKPIHWACRKGHSAIVQILLKVRIKIYVYVSNDITSHESRRHCIS